MSKKVVNLNVNEKTFYKYWLEFTKPFHKLKKRETDVLALLLYYRYKYKEVIQDDKILWKMVFDYDTKMLIKKELGDMGDQVLQNSLTKLRKGKVIIDNEINSAYIPTFKKNDKVFEIIYRFNINEEKHTEEDKGNSKGA